METTFDGNPFRIYKLRKPQSRQIDKIITKVKECEQLYYSRAARVDVQYNNHPENIRQNINDSNKASIVRYLRYEYCKEFKWTWTYYQQVLDQVLNESPVFNRSRDKPANYPAELRLVHEKVAEIKEKYKNEFEKVRGTVAEYNSNMWTGFINT